VNGRGPPADNARGCLTVEPLIVDDAMRAQQSRRHARA